MLTFGSCATGTYEPCQGRNTAALSRIFCVPQGSLDRVNCKGNVGDSFSKPGARYIDEDSRGCSFFYEKHFTFMVLSIIMEWGYVHLT